MTQSPVAERWPRSYAWTAYLVAALLVIGPPVDVMVQMPAFQFGTPMWRFGFFGLMASAMLLPILGALIWLVTARAFGHRWMARIVGVGSGLAGLLLATMFVLFILDALQVRNQVQPEAMRRFDAPVIKALAMQVMSMVALAFLAISGFRGWSRGGRSERTTGSERRDRVLVSQPGS